MNGRIIAGFCTLIGLLVVVTGAAAGWAVNFNDKIAAGNIATEVLRGEMKVGFASAALEQSRFEAMIREIASDIQAMRRDTYTLSNASEAAARMALYNPGMRVPDPRDPSKVIEVRP